MFLCVFVFKTPCAGLTQALALAACGVACLSAFPAGILHAQVS